MDLITERPEWMADGLCHGAVNLFFPEVGANASRAKAICAQCPVREPCLQHALETPERFGVWGGTSEKERRRMRRRLGISHLTGGQQKPIPHGTKEGYARCYQRPEGSCAACRDAYSRYHYPDGESPGGRRRIGERRAG